VLVALDILSLVFSKLAVIVPSVITCDRFVRIFDSTDPIILIDVKSDDKVMFEVAEVKSPVVATTVQAFVPPLFVFNFISPAFDLINILFEEVGVVNVKSDAEGAVRD